MILESEAFGEGAHIPTRYTCDGDGVSPPLSWHGAPPSATVFALVVDDPDAPAGETLGVPRSGLRGDQRDQVSP
jgi:phosphatidylethanolamine-binding protein (PEBP) family uncharacterized protein